MKIIIKNYCTIIFFLFLILFALLMTNSYATSSNTLDIPEYTAPLKTTNELDNKNKSELVEMKDKTTKDLNKYEELYGSKAYGYTAYALDKIRIFSIPLCFLGIAVGAIYQYVIGIRKLDVRDKGFSLMIGFVTILILCQLLPILFAIVVLGWRG